MDLLALVLLATPLDAPDDLKPDLEAKEARPRLTEADGVAEDVPLGLVFWAGVGTATVGGALLLTAAVSALVGELVAATPTLAGSTRAVGIYTVWWALGLGALSTLGVLVGGELMLYGALAE